MDWITNSFSAVVAMSTAIYACLTWSLVRETTRLRKVETNPRVDVTVEQAPGARQLFTFRVANIGKGPAYNIRLEVHAANDSQPTRDAINYLSGINFVSNMTSYLAPGEAISTLFPEDLRVDSWIEKKEIKIRVIVRYNDDIESQLESNYVIDMARFDGIVWLEEKKPLHDIASYIAKIQTELQYNGLNVNVRGEIAPPKKDRSIRQRFAQMKKTNSSRRRKYPD